MYIGVVSSYWLLCITHLWTSCSSCCVGKFFSSLGWIPRGGISQSCGESILQNRQTVSQSGSTIAHSYQWCVKVSVSLLPHPRLLLCAFFIIAAVGVTWYLSVILICISFFSFIDQVQFSAFSPHPFPPPQPSPPPSPVSTAVVIVHVSFIIVPVNPSPFSLIIPSPLPSGHCQPVLNFNVFGYILFACSFWLGSVRGEVIWYLSLTAWLISLSIMLSSSCCKG